MEFTAVVYRSDESKTEELANNYLQTHHVPHRYLAYRDVPEFIHQFVIGKRTLDFGSGTGASAEFLNNLGLEVIGLDISASMLETAKSNFPHIDFYHVNEYPPCGDFDLTFSSFVLLELSSKEEITEYLKESVSFLKEGGIFMGIVGSEHLYSLSRKWMTFNANFKENQALQSGDTVRVALKHPEMEFYDYYWKESDYLECFKEANLEIVKIHFPLGRQEESYVWEDEMNYSPFIIFIARKK